MCGKHGLANWAAQFFPIGQHHPVVRMSLWARYKAPRWVLDIFKSSQVYIQLSLDFIQDGEWNLVLRVQGETPKVILLV